MKNRLFLLFLFCLTITSKIKTQISGVITDLNQQKLQEVTVVNLRTNSHTHSDMEGRFILKDANTKDSLLFSYLGYQTSIYIIPDHRNIQEIQIKMNESFLLLDQIRISEPLYNNLQKIDLDLMPISNSQEVLRKVPGLNIAQHGGGGKAEQIFLRGFDLDHGTDIAISVDQMIPVNMPSHAHGQGYADLHFIIPETVKSIEFEKGSYDVSYGNFATAGSVNLGLYDKIKSNVLIFEIGKFNSHRLATMFTLLNENNQDAYVSTEFVNSKGYFEHPQDFKRYNALIKYNHRLNNKSVLKLTGTYFNSQWKASGQIPERAVNSGMIDRFGAIDPNEGGTTYRSNVMLEYNYSGRPDQFLKIKGFLSQYDFKLLSNFTFFLYDSIHGDKIIQKENREIYGLESGWTKQSGNLELNLTVGTRIDFIRDNELSHTKDYKEILNRKSFGDVYEKNVYTYQKLNYRFKQLEFQIQQRLDYFHFNYNDKISNTSRSKNELKFSPKLKVYFTLNPTLMVYFKTGMGFHTNDTRLIFQEANSDLLTSSTHFDVGLQTKFSSGSSFHLGVWTIHMEDELVYVGDEAIVSSVGPSLRKGIEAGWKWKSNKWFSLEAEGSYTLAKLTENPDGINYIPLATKWSSSGSIQFENLGNFSLGLRYRFLGDRPANEDYSIIALGFQLMDGNISYKYKNLKLSFIAENIFNTSWNEAQFATLSKLQYEEKAVEEIHFTPGSPFNFRFKLQIDF